MKFRVLLLVTMASLLTLPAFAQEESSLEVSISSSLYPQLYAVTYGEDNTYEGSVLDIAYNQGHYGKCYVTPLVKAEYVRYFSKMWALSVGAGASFAWQDLTKSDGSHGHAFDGVYLTTVPAIRFVPLNHEKIKLYCAFGFGILQRINYGVYYYSSQDGYKPNGYDIKPAVQWCPIGIQLGGKWHINAELGLGMEYMGVKFGAGLGF